MLVPARLVAFINRVAALIVWFYLRLRLDILLWPGKHKFLKLTVSMFPFIYRYKSSWFWDRIGGENYRLKAVGAEQHRVARSLLGQAMGQIKFSRVLEVGCGTGDNLIYLKKLYPDVALVGCDFSKKQIQLARQTQGIQFDIADARKLPYGNGEFDVVITIGCLAHIPPQHIKQCVSELQRVAKKHLFIWEEDKKFTKPMIYEVDSRTGWHFYHDYENLFNQCHLEYCNNDTPSMQTVLHTHIYHKRKGDFNGRLD